MLILRALQAYRNGLDALTPMEEDVERLNANEFAWLFMGIPAVLAWFAAGLCWLLALHLGIEPQVLVWAMYACFGWYGLMIGIFGGWVGLALLASLS